MKNFYTFVHRCFSAFIVIAADFFRWLVEHTINGLDFILETFLDLAGCLVVLYGCFELAVWLKSKDPTIGIPDPSVLLLAMWGVAMLYAGLVVAQALFRRTSPTISKYGSSGGFKADWENCQNKTFKMAVYIAVAMGFIYLTHSTLSRY